MSQGHRRWFANELPELLSKGLLSEEAAVRLSEHFNLSEFSGEQPGLSKMTIILAAIGGLLIGGGVIMIFAHNWDQIGRDTRMKLALSPLLISQVFALLALFPKERGTAWREATAAFMFCAVPASIALVGQSYHISNDFQSFQTWWFVLILPFVYLLKSKLIAIFAMMLAMWMAALHRELYWLCAVSLIPFHFFAEPYGRNQLNSKIGWIFAIGLSFSILITQTDIVDGNVFALLVFMSGAAAIYFLGGFAEPNKGFWLRPFTNIGAVSIAINLLMYTFTGMWEAIHSAPDAINLMQFLSYEVLIILLACIGLAWTFLTKQKELLPLGSTLFFILLISFIPVVNWRPNLFVLIANLMVLSLGIWYLWLGINRYSTSRMNFGLALIMILILLRFFDQDFSFIVKGVAFIIMGSAFISVNLWQSRRSCI